MESVSISPTRNDQCDWSAVRKAFPLERIRINGRILLRPLKADDIDKLSEFLVGDPEMTWTHKAWTRENIKYILSLRLDHYASYGFGPYGVVLDGELRGMVGMQVWEFEECAIEQVAYIAKAEWSQGLATMLLRWGIRRARDVGQLKELYAATRADNQRSIGITERLGFVRIGEGKHFGYPAIYWRLSLGCESNERE